MSNYDAIIIGAGHNGLVAAAYLAKAGQRVLVLERRDEVGGILANVEIAEGFHAPGPVHTVGRLRESVINDLGLTSKGLELITPDVRLFAPQPDGTARTFWADTQKTADELATFDPADGPGYLEFDKKIRAFASFFAHLNAITPTNIDSPSAGDALNGMKLGKAFKDLGPKTGREVTRALPMAIADFVRESLSSDAACGALAARSVLYTGMGAWSASTSMVLINDSAGNDGGAAGQTVFAKGGPAALADALRAAATGYGAEVRTGAEVVRITTTDGRATGVVLSGGDELRARCVVTSANPKTTLLDLVDPMEIGPRLRWEAGNIRTPGKVSKVNLALSGLPAFIGGADEERLSGRIVIAPGIDYIEKAYDASKYGAISTEPIVEATIPTLTDPSVAPAGKHILSAVVQYTPYALRDSDWDAEKEGVGKLAVDTLEKYAPGLGALVEATHVTTPVDLERDYGLTGGHVYHAEYSLDSFFAWRPLLGHGRYRFGIPGLYLAGSGAHPGGGVTGAPGANAAREILDDLKKSK